MKFKSIVSLCLSFVILFSSVGPVRAVDATNAAYFANGSFWDQMLIGLVMGAVEWPFGDTVQDIAATVSGEICPSSEDGLHRTSRAGLLGRPSGFNPDVGRYGVAVCDHCGKDFKLYSGDLKERGQGFVDGLDGTEASNSVAVTGFSCTKVVTAYSYDPVSSSLYVLTEYFPEQTTSMVQSLGINDKVAVLSMKLNSPYSFAGLYFDSSGTLCVGFFTNPHGVINASFLGVYDLDDLILEKSDFFLSDDGYRVFYDKFFAMSWSGFAYSNCYAFDFSNSFKVSKGCTTFVGFRKQSVNLDFDDNVIDVRLSSTQTIRFDSYMSRFDHNTIVWDNSRIVVGPSNTDNTSRTSSLMQTIHTYNTNNSYVDNSSNVNFFLVPSGEDPAEDTVVSPVIYDEETLVYTDPVTGTEYLTNGWTYDYLTRCYTLDMADDTYTIGDMAIDTIKLTYGDELLTVDHYSGGSLIQSDEYNYVMMSGSECGLNGHSYTYEEVKTPTCTSTGERKYTCTVCGDQYAEEVPMTAHAYTYSVLKEPTCIDSGINVYTCSTCGNQVTETVEALGHDWQETSSTTTTVTLPEGTSCPECSGADFAMELDEANEIYRLTCNGCGHVWVVPAEVTYGATTYTCTRCGTTKTESDDPESGLFNSIGNLIADGITWATDKMTQLIESISGLTDIFNDFVEDVKNSSGQYPAFLGAVIALLPEDLMNVFWFGLVALIIIAVWKKWFS